MFKIKSIERIANIVVVRKDRVRVVPLDRAVDELVLQNILEEMKKTGIEFCFYDEMYPSPTDPGAYFSYAPREGTWKMTFGNHGWSGGIYTISDAVLLKQLHSLHSIGSLVELKIDGVCFFSHYDLETESTNREMNQRLVEIHA